MEMKVCILGSVAASVFRDGGTVWSAPTEEKHFLQKGGDECTCA